MTLRTRILSAFGFVLLLLLALAVIVVLVQRSQLIEQLDDRLETSAPLEPVNRPGGLRQPAGGAPLRAVDEPISDLYLAEVFDDGTVEVRVQGQLLTNLPDIDAIALRQPVERKIFTATSSDRESFRVLMEPRNNSWLVVAVPTATVDASVRQLVVSFLIAALLIASTLVLVAWWINRLGLRPIVAVTETARAITAGEREDRAPLADPRTEAGELASAFNVMLDDRDKTEDKLRQFIADASHELRTPLTSIRGYLDLYSEGGFREPGQLDDVVRRMQSESSRMSGLVDQLLQLARMDEGVDLNVDTVDVSAMLQAVVSDAHAAHPDRSISIDHTQGNVQAELDADKVHQLVVGLVNNALVHAPEASVVLGASAEGNELLLSVSDDGPGLSDSDTARVFDRFYRTDSSRARSSGGSGLGLSIARDVARLHGGDIELTTAVGEGCTFLLRLPRG